jgi:hypothetical protein
MESKITRRILAETGIPRLFSVLAEELPAGDLQSLLLEVYQARARTIREPDLLVRSKRSALTAPSSVDARHLNTFDRVAFQTAVDFEAVELSPVCPLGTAAVLGGIDQNNVLTMIRNAEVLGDSTPALALECARRRRELTERTPKPVRLASSQRVVRLQPFDVPGFTPHFRLFALVSAGRDTGSHSFEVQHLGEHVRFYLSLFRALNQEGFQLTSPLVEISDLRMSESLLNAAGISREQVREMVRAHIPGGSERFLGERGITLPAQVVSPKDELPESIPQQRLQLLKERIVDALAPNFPEAEFRFNLARLEGLGYYTGLCLRISPMAPDGVRYPITDGGFTDWTARLLQDKKERLLTTGIGSEFVCRRYRAIRRE